VIQRWKLNCCVGINCRAKIIQLHHCS